MNSNEDWYQSAIFEYKINEITEHFVNKDLIGKGSFSLVYKTKCESLEGIVVAIKEVNIISNDYNSLKTFITEVYAEKKLYYLVLEYANQGNLREFINEKNRNENDFEWKERVNLATQIAEGLCYLHKLNIAHRDLHTKNILINDGNIKISDFGLSKDLESTMSSEPESRPLIDQVHLQLQSISLKPIFEGSNNPISIDTEKEKTPIAANFKRRSQPLGARPNQLSKDNVEIFVESISVIEAYKTCFRFTNKPLQLDFILSEPKNASEKSLYFNDQGLLECQLKRIDL
ncbi:12475_t:CDS:2 [Rhizophagus irregularis]|nr:12475_t:CDS:2 [Rhizophagus irregularis]